ncbi:oxidoreductase [Planomonospora parontospora subsp. parontospora]|uniref:Oxidoreductase n=2 Tax=Planomonospora parontospora TaxID=58119 RepID=A0AA37BJA1_9ACTN|nr:FAD-binding oxidoreductase [Planomonospora parontospora]GGK79041.1 oxidoreductase [Planomonospora parontospora]GII10251.1 oxidoreductase [Planomonospora parontospora subsp. parontospora]
MNRLADQVMGPVLAPRDEGYDAERAGWQTARRHRPDLVVGAAGPADVRAAVAYASGRGLPVAVQGTGHASAAVAANGGVLITTARMSAVRVDADAGTAWVAAGTRWDQVIHRAAPAGLSPLSGSAPRVGAVSYTLGGGLALLSRTFGYAADHVRGLDVVTADGRLRRVTRDCEPDLFWALRGGRDNFGVVTGMEIDLMPVTTLYGGALVFPVEKAADAFGTYLQWAATVPEAMNSSIALISLPDVPAIPGPLRGRYTVHVRIACAADDPGVGERLVAPLRAIGPMSDTLGALAYAETGSIYNDPVASSAVESGTAMLGELDATAVQAILDLAGPHAPVPHIVELRHLGGRLAHPPAVENAVGNRDARYLFNVVSRLERADITRIRPAHARMFEAIAPWSTGGRFLNFMNGEKAATQVRSAYNATDYRRLTDLKAVYDPENVFRLNHNIPPG